MNKRLWLAVGIGWLALALRLPGLGTFMTADEAQWMMRSAEFHHKLFHQADPGGTFITSHPGATAMWIIGLGEFIQEKRLGFDVDEGTLPHFRLAATLPMAIITSLLIGAAVWLASALWGNAPAAAAGVLLAADPYLTGMSQIAHLDSLLALLMLNAVLAFGGLLRDVLQSGTNWGEVLVGLFTGLALATKLLLALWLPVFFALVLFPKSHIRQFFFIAGVAAVTFYLMWPALWVKADIGNTLERDVPSVIQDEHVADSASAPSSPATFYLKTVLGRTTPWVLALAAIGISMICRKKGSMNRTPTILLIYLIGYLVLISLAAKKADRYALPALVALPVFAGWALMVCRGALARVLGFDKSNPYISITSAILLTAVILFVLLLSPHAIAYNNPWLPNIRPLHQQGWGEGLEQAAAWLNTHPLGEKLTIASWYPSVTGAYFKGKTLSLSSRDDARVGYVVTYRNMGGRGQDDQASTVLQELAGQQPEQTILIQGIPYVWIYNTIGLPYFNRHTDELIGGRQIGQTIPVSRDHWDAIDLGLATFSSRPNTQDVIVHVRDHPAGQTDIRRAVINASQIADSDWTRFSFEPIADSAGQTFFVFIESPGSVPGDAIAVRYAASDIRPGEMYSGGQRRAADIAYRIP